MSSLINHLMVLSSVPFAPFSGALAAALMLLIAEVAILVVAGHGVSHVVDAIVHPAALPDGAFANWLMLREVPLLMVIVSLVCGFGITGLAIQGLETSINGKPLSLMFAIPIAVIGSGFITRLVLKGMVALKVVNTMALKPEEFIGQVATLISPAIRQGSAGEAHFIDRFGVTHQVMVEPEWDHQRFVEGDKLVLLRQINEAVYAVRSDARV